jgi:hypothetical protein
MSGGNMLYSAEGRVNTKLSRQADILRSNSSSSSYRTNSTKEELCLEYISSFVHHYDSRATRQNGLKSKERAKAEQRMSPFIVAKNEYGVEKLVCSTIRLELCLEYRKIWTEAVLLRCLRKNLPPS